MTGAVRPRARAAAGVAFVVLLNVALFAPGPPPRASDSAAEIAGALADDRAAILGGMFVAGLATFVGVWFFCAVAAWIRRAAPDADPTYAFAVVAAGVLTVAFTMLGMLLFYGASYDVAGRGGLESVRALTDAGNATIEMSKFSTALFISATLAAAAGTTLLPRWLVRFGVVAVVALIVSAIALFSESSFTEFGGGLDLAGAAPGLAWVVALSIQLGREGRP